VSVRKRRLRGGRPLWLADAGPLQQRYPALSGHQHTTVAVIGGGMTGALVAHAFASAGVATTVLEAALVGSGSTVASSALLLKEPDRELTDLVIRYGAPAGRRMWELSHQSADQLVALLKRLRIDCKLKMTDAIYYASTAQAARRLGRECDLRTRSGFHARWLDPGQLRRLTGIAGHGAILSKNSAQFDPYRACAGIVRKAAAAGAEVFERSEVRRIEPDGHGVHIRTHHGTLHAERVIIATGYATPRFRPLTGRFRMYRTYVLATEPIGKVQRDDIGLTDVMVWDTDRPYHYARWTSDHRLLLGGGDRLIRAGQRRQPLTAAASGLRAYFEARIPALATVRTEYSWEGLFAMTGDSLPYIGSHRRYPRHWFALGYGGNGMTFGFLAARHLLERWQGLKSGDHTLFEFARLSAAFGRRVRNVTE